MCIRHLYALVWQNEHFMALSCSCSISSSHPHLSKRIARGGMETAMAMALTQICMSAQANSCIELHLNAENGAHKHKSAARSVVREYQRINTERERGSSSRGSKARGKPRNCGQLESPDRAPASAVWRRVEARRSERFRSNPKYVMKIRKQDILSLRNGHQHSTQTHAYANVVAAIGQLAPKPAATAGTATAAAAAKPTAQS